jgi:tetratricopeptide (TPR) repeat protein
MVSASCESRPGRRILYACRVPLLFILASSLWLLIARDGRGQFGSLPQADSPEEFDAYLDVISRSRPADVISSGREFEKSWPHSPLRGPVCQLELQAYRSLNDPSNAIEAGQRALEFAPGNLQVTAELAFIIADTTAEPQQLIHAEDYARRTLQSLKTFTVPKWIPPQEWGAIEGRLKSEVHVALGLVAYKRGGIPQAIREFETAIDLAPEPEPAQYYRLGMLYQASGNKSAAIQKLQRAAQMNDQNIRSLAEEELKVLDH